MQKRSGKLPSYELLEKNGDLAELIGVILGDGTITKFPRTEALRIVGTWSNQGFIRRYAELVEKVFKKMPHVAKRTYSNAGNITIYQKNIGRRLCIPVGAKGNITKVLPKWIADEEVYIIRYLRGLYEAEGSYCVHEPTYTHKFLFSNANLALLRVVYILVRKLGFHPHVSYRKVQVSRKAEVQKLKNLLQFRCYD